MCRLFLFPMLLLFFNSAYTIISYDAKYLVLSVICNHLRGTGVNGIQLPVEIYCSRVTQKQILINVCCEILNDNGCLLLEGLAVRCLAPPLAREPPAKASSFKSIPVAANRICPASLMVCGTNLSFKIL